MAQAGVVEAATQTFTHLHEVHITALLPIVHIPPSLPLTVVILVGIGFMCS
jgi:hypothetical protein